MKIRREEITLERLKRLAWFGVLDSVECVKRIKGKYFKRKRKI